MLNTFPVIFSICRQRKSSHMSSLSKSILLIGDKGKNLNYGQFEKILVYLYTKNTHPHTKKIHNVAQFALLIPTCFSPHIIAFDFSFYSVHFPEDPLLCSNISAPPSVW